jgi:hypothetical protein
MTASSHARTNESHERRRLILLEEGTARLTRWIATNCDETVIVAKLPGETALDFADRALQRIIASERSGRSFHHAALCTLAPLDADARIARRLIALGLAAHAESARTLDALIIYAPVDANLVERQVLIELADDLALATEGKPLPVRLQLVDSGASTASEAVPAQEAAVA